MTTIETEGYIRQIVDLERRCEEQATEIGVLQDRVAHLHNEFDAALTEAFERRYGELVEALRFYADEANYDYDEDFPERINLITWDTGARARQVLKKYAVDDEGGESL